MPKIIWNEDLAVGIEQFDAHHQHLISLINETTHCLENGASLRDISVVVNSLIDYAWYHFSAEEKWMKEHAYPQQEEHADIHKRFSTRILELQKQLTDNSVAVATELATYLNFWLIDHIVISDSKYASFAGTRNESLVMT